MVKLERDITNQKLDIPNGTGGPATKINCFIRIQSPSTKKINSLVLYLYWIVIQDICLFISLDAISVLSVRVADPDPSVWSDPEPFIKKEETGSEINLKSNFFLHYVLNQYYYFSLIFHVFQKSDSGPIFFSKVGSGSGSTQPESKILLSEP